VGPCASQRSHPRPRSVVCRDGIGSRLIDDADQCGGEVVDHLWPRHRTARAAFRAGSTVADRRMIQTLRMVMELGERAAFGARITERHRMISITAGVDHL